jgi:hypothetical protein
MKIRTDTVSPPIARSSSVRDANRVSRTGAPSDPGRGGHPRITAGQPAKAGVMDRALGEALGIAQLSQNIIQRALTVSMRLRSIAASAVITGSVNDSALSEAMSDIRGVLEDYGERLPSPPRTAPSGAGIELPDIRGPVGALRDVAVALGRGEHRQERALDDINGGLAERAITLSRSEDTLVRLMGNGRSVEVLDETSANRLATSAVNFITVSPSSAVMAQGNISLAYADRLIK